MTPLVRRAAAALLAAGALLAVAALSQVPYGVREGEGALLRLSWRTVSERVEECRKLSEAELEALPVHMRRPEVCEGRMLAYRLRVELDGRTVVDDTVRPAGARGDRPLYVFRELPLPPGAHRLSVRFVREDGGGSPSGSRDRRAAPGRLELEERLELRPGEVALVTFDPDLRSLIVRTPDGPAGR